MDDDIFAESVLKKDKDNESIFRALVDLKLKCECGILLKICKYCELCNESFCKDCKYLEEFCKKCKTTKLKENETIPKIVNNLKFKCIICNQIISKEEIINHPSKKEHYETCACEQEFLKIEIEEHKKKCPFDLISCIQKISNSYQSLNETNQRLEKELESSNKRIEELEESSESSNKRVEELQMFNQKLEKQLESSKKKIGELQMFNQKLEKLVQSSDQILEKQLESSNKRIGELENSLQSSKQRSKESIESLNKEIEVLRILFQTLSEVPNPTIMNSINKTNQKFQETTDSINQRLSDLEKNKMQDSQNISKLNLNFDALKSQLNHSRKTSMPLSKDGKFKITIKITSPILKSCTLEVYPSFTIHSILKKIESEVDLTSELQLIFAGRVLENHKTLSYYNIQKECTLHLKQNNQQIENQLKIFVKTITGKTISFYLDKSAKIQSVKQMIERELNIPHSQQILKCSGKKVDDDRFVEEYLKENSNLLFIIA